MERKTRLAHEKYQVTCSSCAYITACYSENSSDNMLLLTTPSENTITWLVKTGLNYNMLLLTTPSENPITWLVKKGLMNNMLLLTTPSAQCLLAYFAFSMELFSFFCRIFTLFWTSWKSLYDTWCFSQLSRFNLAASLTCTVLMNIIH